MREYTKNENIMDNTMSNQLIGIGYESSRIKGQFWWLTIYKSVTDDFDNVMHFINDYYEERKSPSA